MTTIRNPPPPPPTSAPTTTKPSGLAGALTATPSDTAAKPNTTASEFLNAKDRPLSLSGAFRGVKLNGNPDLPAGTVSEMFKAIDAGKMQADTAKKAPPFDAAAFLGKLSKLPAKEAQNAVYGLSEPERTALVKAVASGKTSPSAEVVHALIKSSPSADIAKVLQGIPDATLKSVSKLVKADGPMPTVGVGVAVELAARTQWGKSHKAEVADLRKRSTDFTKLTNGETGGLGSYRDGKIKYADKLLTNPEALAAVLGHEVTHAHQGVDCCADGKGPSGPEGEIQANVVTAQIWAEIGDPATSPDPSFNGYAEAWTKAGGAKGNGAAAVRERALTKYLENANEKIAERKKNPDSASKNADDSLESWQATAKVFQDALDKAKAGKGTRKLSEVEVKKK
ncbi:MAG: hypothetical protein JNM17_35440 [Archangium sp.]|nr:hypothetical protein [Archangium sp.]